MNTVNPTLKDWTLGASGWKYFVGKAFSEVHIILFYWTEARFMWAGKWCGLVTGWRVRIEGNSISTGYVLYTVSLWACVLIWWQWQAHATRDRVTGYRLGEELIQESSSCEALCYPAVNISLYCHINVSILTYCMTYSPVYLLCFCKCLCEIHAFYLFI